MNVVCLVEILYLIGQFGGGRPHWIAKGNIGTMSSENGGYLTMTIDLEKSKIALYKDGEFVGETVCSHDWMIGGGLTDNFIPFTIGFQTGGTTYTEYYANMNIYACRLYNKVLTSDEVKANYDKTVAYHNVLVQSKN